MAIPPLPSTPTSRDAHASIQVSQDENDVATDESTEEQLSPCSSQDTIDPDFIDCNVQDAAHSCVNNRDDSLDDVIIQPCGSGTQVSSVSMPMGLHSPETIQRLKTNQVKERVRDAVYREVFREYKFVCRVETMDYSDNPKSICSIVSSYVGVNSNKPTKQVFWALYRGMVRHRLAIRRNNCIRMIRPQFLSKCLCSFQCLRYLFVLITFISHVVLSRIS